MFDTNGAWRVRNGSVAQINVFNKHRQSSVSEIIQKRTRHTSVPDFPRQRMSVFGFDPIGAPSSVASPTSDLSDRDADFSQHDKGSQHGSQQTCFSAEHGLAVAEPQRCLSDASSIDEMMQARRAGLCGLQSRQYQDLG